MDEGRSSKHRGIKWGLPEPILVKCVVLGHPRTELIMGGPAADKDHLVLHGDVLHGKDRLSPKPPYHKVHPVPGDEPLHGIGGIRDVEEFVGIRPDKLDLHLLVADLNTPPGIDLIRCHERPVPVALALHILHRADYADLDLSTPLFFGWTPHARTKHE